MATIPYHGEGEAADNEVVATSLSDPESFAEIFERHFFAIHRYLARRVGSELADDLAAQVFIVAFERRATFRPETGSARPWLYGIATNLIRNQRRSEHRLLAATTRLGNEATLSADSTESVEDDIDRPRIARALAELDPDQRDVLLLHTWAELSHVEIATALGIPPGTVASRISRARGRLRTALIGELGNQDPRLVNISPEEDKYE